MPGWFHRGPRWGGRPMPPPPPPPPRFPPPNFPPPSFGLCQGNFSGSFENGREVYVSLNGNGYSVSAMVMLDNPDQNLAAQGTCQESGDSAILTLTLENGVVETGSIYRASDGQIYLDGTQSYDGQRFILERQ
jgi:hypothetical protein